MDGLDRASQSHGLPQFRQGQIGLLAQQRAHLAMMRGQDGGLAAGTMMLGSDVTEAAALLQEFLDHAQRNFVTAGYFLPIAFLLIIRSEDSLAQVQGERLSLHAQKPITRLPFMAIVLFKLL